MSKRSPGNDPCPTLAWLLLGDERSLCAAAAPRQQSPPRRSPVNQLSLLGHLVATLFVEINYPFSKSFPRFLLLTQSQTPTARQ